MENFYSILVPILHSHKGQLIEPAYQRDLIEYHKQVKSFDILDLIMASSGFLAWFTCLLNIMD